MIDPRLSKPSPTPPSPRKPLRRGKYLARSTKPLKRSPIRKGVGRTKQRRLKEYAAHIRSPFWKALRRVVFERDDYRCVSCGTEAGWFKQGSRDMRGLECDHIRYTRFGNELPSDCQTLCRPCHRQKHAGGWHRRRVA